MEMAKSINSERIFAKDRLILALDVDIKRCKEIIVELGDLAKIVKINYSHFFEMSIKPEAGGFLEFLLERNIETFFDLKFDDIQNTVETYIKMLVGLGNVSFCTIHGNSSLMEAAVKGRNGFDRPKILIVTVLTSLDSHDLKDVYNTDTPQSVEDLVLHRAKSAFKFNLDGVIASGRHAGMIKQTLGEKFLVVSPGIRLNGNKDDHKRVTTPEEAILNGSDYLVIGRPIYNATDYAKVTEKIIERMQQAFDEKINQ